MRVNFDQLKLEDIARRFSLKFVILHGSFAKGSTHKQSDLDIAALAEQALDFRKELTLYGEMGEIFKLPPETDLDFKTLNKVDPLFRYEVTRDGKLLYGNAVDYEDYKAFAFRAYEDARPLFELERLQIYKFQSYLNARYLKQIQD
jgi:predicted nucleotidyltransferase